MLIIGKVIKPHGIRGSIKVQNFMDSPYAFSKINEMCIDSHYYNVESIRTNNDFAIVKLKNIDSIESAEKLRNQNILIQREDAPNPEEGRYYIDDLLGLDIYIKDKHIGILDDILQYGSADIYCIKGDKNIMFPFVGNVIENIDTKNKKILLNETEFLKVAVYED